MNLNEYPLWTAVITPMKNDGSVDYASLEKVLRDQEAAGNGWLILGSTGESLNLDEAERREILNFSLKLKPKVPVMVGVGGSNLRETKEWVSYLNTLPVHAYLLVTPLYAKPGVMGQYYWFKELLDLSSRPCMLYNVPSRTGKALEHKTVQMLADHSNFWAIKEASGSVEEFKKYRTDAPSAHIFSGDDGLTPDFAQHGAKGLVSVASNAWPKETNLFTRQSLAGTLDAKELWQKAADSLFIASNPVPVKRLMQEQKVIATAILRAPLCHEDLNDASPLLTAEANVKRWYNDQKGSEK
jgi:4-hydroxy-tetrahydrodipicolinate synthase